MSWRVEIVRNYTRSGKIMGVVIEKRSKVREDKKGNGGGKKNKKNKKNKSKRKVEKAARGHGKVMVTRPDGSVGETDTVTEVITTENGPFAEVGLSTMYTKNMGNYESAKIGVVLRVPCENTDKAIEAAFSRVNKFCEDKLAEAVNELEEYNNEG